MLFFQLFDLLGLFWQNLSQAGFQSLVLLVVKNMWHSSVGCFVYIYTYWLSGICSDTQISSKGGTLERTNSRHFIINNLDTESDPKKFFVVGCELGNFSYITTPGPEWERIT